MPEILETDICVIGAGSGGLSVAAAAAGFGVPVVLIEKGRMGGDCLNYGCVPSKALIAAARRAADFATSAEFGVSAGKPTIDFPRGRPGGAGERGGGALQGARRGRGRQPRDKGAAFRGRRRPPPRDPADSRP